MAYLLTRNTTYLWASRKIDRFYYNTQNFQIPPPHFEDLTHANLSMFNLTNIVGAEDTRLPTQTFMRVTPNGPYRGLLPNRGAMNNNTVLVPDKIFLRTGNHDQSAWAMLGLSGAGHHANTDQRLCLDNSMFMGAFMVHRSVHSSLLLTETDGIVPSMPTSVTDPLHRRTASQLLTLSFLDFSVSSPIRSTSATCS